jgi:hypothetical protein
MAKIHIERSYIEPFEENDAQSHAILIHIKDGDNHIYAGKVELNKNVPWIYTENAKNGDLDINYSAGMEVNIFNYIIEEIIDG